MAGNLATAHAVSLALLSVQRRVPGLYEFVRYIPLACPAQGGRDA